MRAGLGAWACAATPTALGIAAAAAPRIAVGSDIGLADRVDLLYSTKFQFDARGEPRITVGLMEGQTRVRLSARAGLHALPSGEGGTRVLGSGRWQVDLASGVPSRQRWSISLESLPATDLKAIDAALRTWRERGFKVAEREIGALFGVGGTVLDTRRVLLTTADHGTESDAERESRVIQARHGGEGRLHPLIERRSSGMMIATDLDSGVRVQAEGVLWFVAPDDETITVHDVEYGTTIGPRGRGDRSYRGQVYVAIDRHGKLAVVNAIAETDVLSGLVPAEMYASAPAAALRAQAIAARGQLLAKLGNRHLDDPYLLCAHQHCQVYAGREREHPRTNTAVRDTRGLVLMRPEGTQLVDTVYSANCGGHTEDNEQVWPSPPDPQLRGRPDPLLPAGSTPLGASGRDEAALRAWIMGDMRSHSRPLQDSAASSYRWTALVDPAAVAGRAGVPAEIGAVRTLEVLARGRSGRATRVRVTGERGAVDVAGELTIRRALGDLRSSAFLVEPERDRHGRFVLRGAGHGHGVGMCQHGAIGMANAGLSHEKIVAHYYAGARPTKLW